MKKGDVLRKCLGCREVFEKKKLIRFVLSPDNEIILDYYSKLPGRGAYICFNRDCVEKAFKSAAFKKVFKCNVKSIQVNDIINIFTDKCLEKILSLLSIAVRSRNVFLGTEAVEGGLKKGSLSLLLLAADLSVSAKKQWEGKATVRGIEIKILPDFGKMDTVVGSRKIIALKDIGMAKAMLEEFGKLQKMGIDLI